MKTKEYSSLGLKVNFSVPESVEEFDANAKRIGACLEEATNNSVYRGMLGDFRDVLLHGWAEKGIKGLDDIYGVERKTKPVLDRKTNLPRKDKDDNEVTTYDETEEEFLDRVLAEKGLKIEDIQEHANTVAASLVFDASAREKKAPKPKKLSSTYLDAAKKLLEKYEDSKINKTFAKFIPDQATFARTGDAAKDAETLGWLFKAYNEAKAAAGEL
jgi:hypothetical protein